jgi:hypothetical protein
MSTLLESLLTPQERTDATAADLAWRRARQQPVAHMWRLSAVGERPGRGYWAELWRYGGAGEPSIVHECKYFATAAARDESLERFLP